MLDLRIEKKILNYITQANLTSFYSFLRVTVLKALWLFCYPRGDPYMSRHLVEELKNTPVVSLK